ncbi:MAG: hypothetical protein HY744_08855 [Deltaproteobacteria bacterium]|nr:hypothetical protein [Deltaproteobacteria bacterium]
MDRHRPSRPRSLRRHAAVLATLGLLAAPGLTCVDLLELEGYRAAAQQLCALLDRCYGQDYYPSCGEQVTARLEAAPAEARSSWLTHFADYDCLGNCTSATLCLDVPPLCLDVAAGCGRDLDCCGFSRGTGRCSVAGPCCCLPDGNACSGNAQCCNDNCQAGLCGGVACKQAGKPCANGFECCSGICDQASGQCTDIACLPDGANCSENHDCCSGSCPIDGQGAGTCTANACLADDEACAEANECCGLYCLETGGPAKICSSGACLPDDAICTPGDDAACCSAYCDPSYGRCGASVACAQIGEPCQLGSECCSQLCTDGACLCQPGGGPCQNHGDCCSKSCNSGKCAGDSTCKVGGEKCNSGDDCCSQQCSGGTCCAVVDCNAHNACQCGGPLGAQCAQAAPGFVAEEIQGTCVKDVCAALPSCCCTKWDKQCVAKAEEICKAPCLNGGQYNNQACGS